MTSSNLPRYALWILLGYALWLNYMAWQKDYARLDAVTAAAAAAHPSSGGLISQVPQSQNGSAPAHAPGAAVAVSSAASSNSEPAAVPSAAEVPGNTVAPSLAASPAGEVVHVRTDVLDLDISLVGGTITQADLNVYAKAKGKPARVRLENHDSPESLYLLQVGLTGPAGSARPTQLATFSADQSNYQLGSQAQELRVPLHWTDDHGVSVVKAFIFHRGSYAIDVTQSIQNQSAAPWEAAPYAQILRNVVPMHYSIFSANPERFAFNGPAIYDGTKYRRLKVTDDEDRHLGIEVRDGWIAALQHHFVTAVVPPEGSSYRFTLNVQGNEYALAASGPDEVVPAGGKASSSLTVFLGPKLQSQLAAAGPQLQRVTDFGHLFVIAQPLFKALSVVHSVTGNWGVAILTVTILLKLLFYPLSEASGRSVAKMRALAPRMKNLQEQYKNDKEKLARATMELYQREKVNPVGGCLPMVIQIPVFFAFYWVLQESVEMRQAPFALWITDLSVPDPYFILPILMAGFMFLQQRLNPVSADPMQAKIMMFMPVIMSAMFALLPAGLVLYYVTNTALGVAQQWNINRRLTASTARRKS